MSPHSYLIYDEPLLRSGPSTLLTSVLPSLLPSMSQTHYPLAHLTILCL